MVAVDCSMGGERHGDVEWEVGGGRRWEEVGDECVTWNGGGRDPALAHCESPSSGTALAYNNNL